MSGTDFTLTPNYGLYKPLPTADINQWGGHLNLNADTLDSALLGIAGGAVTVAPGGSIQAAHDSLPATGGLITLSLNTTYTLTATLNITKPYVTIQAPSWNTVIRRGTGLGSVHTISATSAAIGFSIRGVTVDGGGITNTGGAFEISTNGPDSLIQRCQVINFAGQGAIALSGTGSRADGNLITGPSQNNHVGSYGIWAVTHVKTLITNNHISGTSIDAIGFDGPGTQVIGNYVANCQWWAAAPNFGGGQICQYSPGQYPGALIEGNFIDQGGGTLSYGLELNGVNVTVVGNTIVNQQNHGILVDSGSGDGMLFSGNTVINSGQAGPNGTGMSLYGPLNNVMIVGNRFADTQATHTQAWGIYIAPSTYNRVVIVGNDFTGNTAGGVYTPSLAGGSSNIVRDNLNVADLPGAPAVNAANDAAAASAGVAVGGTYRNGSAIMVRVA